MRKLSLRELGRPSVEAYTKAPKQPIALVLDNIRSGLNVGSIFRTADAFAISEVILCGITAKPPQREVLKSAIGATETVLWTHFEDADAAIAHLQAERYVIWGVEQTTESIPLQKVRWKSEKVALVFGNEVRGISEDLLAHVDLAIEIPQFGTKHSLNVAVCAGMIMWHLMAQILE